MPITFEDMRTPRPMTILVEWNGQSLDVTYDRAAFSLEVIEERYRMPIRERVARVLLGWDLLKAGAPWQPLPKDDPSWDAIVLAARAPETEQGPIGFEERTRAYTDAWNAILLQLDRDFVRAVDTGILDDFLGVSWRAGIFVNGSAPLPTTTTGGSTGGTNT